MPVVNRVKTSKQRWQDQSCSVFSVRDIQHSKKYLPPLPSVAKTAEQKPNAQAFGTGLSTGYI